MSERWIGKTNVETMLRAICALHLASYVQDDVEDRGGLMLIAPANALKSTILLFLDSHYHDAVAISNASRSSLNAMQPKFHNGSLRSIIFPEFRTVYSGDPRTGQRIEDYIMQLTGEATRGASVTDDPNAAEKFRGRCTVFGGTTYQFYLSRSVNWNDIGFTRRFLFSFFNLEDPELLNRAGVKWSKVHFGEFSIPEIPASGSIPMLITEPERARILEWLRYQPDNPNHSIRQHLMCRAASVLRWHARVKDYEDDSMKVMKSFSETLQKEAPLLTITNPFPQELNAGFSALKLLKKRNGEKR